MGGIGEGKLYIPLYQDSFRDSLGTRIHPDTINLKVPEFDETFYFEKRIEISSPGSWFYPIHCIPIEIICGVSIYEDSYIILPRIKKNSKDVVQLISMHNVRGEKILSLGDKLGFEIK